MAVPPIPLQGMEGFRFSSGFGPGFKSTSEFRRRRLEKSRQINPKTHLSRPWPPGVPYLAALILLHRRRSGSPGSISLRGKTCRIESSSSFRGFSSILPGSGAEDDRSRHSHAQVQRSISALADLSISGRPAKGGLAPWGHRFIQVIDSCSTVAVDTQAKYGTCAIATHR